MEKLALLGLILFFSCNEVKKTETNNDTLHHVTLKEQPDSIPKINSERIEGDFDGDGQTEFAFGVKIKEGSGNPVEGGEAAVFEIRFSNNKISPINVGCCSIRLINEGDLNKDGADDLSVFQAPMNGNIYLVKTLSLKKKDQWSLIMDPLLVPVVNGDISDKALQERIFLENGLLYFLEVDIDDENFRLVKKQAVLK